MLAPRRPVLSALRMVDVRPELDAQLDVLLGEVLAYRLRLARPKSASLLRLASRSQGSKDKIPRELQELSKSPPLSKASSYRVRSFASTSRKASHDQSRRHRP